MAVLVFVTVKLIVGGLYEFDLPKIGKALGCLEYFRKIIAPIFGVIKHSVISALKVRFRLGNS
jgi:hypothetical protein